MGARKFQLFTNMDLTRATSFAWAKLYVSVCRFQLFTNMDLTRATSLRKANSMSVLVNFNYLQTWI